MVDMHPNLFPGKTVSPIHANKLTTYAMSFNVSELSDSSEYSTV